ncbi:TOBE domain-containing protein, partial [Brevundimonas denitrificans]
SKGRIAQSGTPREIYYNPTDPFVADFIGTLNRVSAASVKGYQGSTPELFFRPEDAEIVSADSGNYSGHVKSAFFLGDRTRLVIAGHDQAEVVVDSKHRAEFAIGTEVHLQMNLDRLIDMSGCEGGQSAC